LLCPYWAAFPDELWKLSVYRGAVRVMLALLWLGFYGGAVADIDRQILVEERVLSTSSVAI